MSSYVVPPPISSYVPPRVMCSVAEGVRACIKITHKNETIKVPIDCTADFLQKRFALPTPPLAVQIADGTELPFPLIPYSSRLHDGEETLLVCGTDSSHSRIHEPRQFCVFSRETDNNANGIFCDLKATTTISLTSIGGRFYTNTLGIKEIFVWISRGQSYSNIISSPHAWQLIKSETFNVTHNKQPFKISLENVRIEPGLTGLCLHCPQDELEMCASDKAGGEHPMLSISAQGYQNHSSAPFVMGSIHSAGFSFAGHISFTQLI